MATITEESKLTRHQVKHYGPKPIKGYGDRAVIKAEVRYDDQCGNGHNSFAITADVYIPGRRDIEAGGCMHDEIVEHFPELAPYIKWHLCSSDGPMHYVANTLYLAGDRDCWGKRKGEPRQWETHIQFGSNPIKHKLPGKFVKWLQENRAGVGGEFDFEVIAYHHEREPKTFGPKYTFGGFAEKWYECPFDSQDEALDFLKALQTCEPRFVRVVTVFGEGKARELDAARRAAIWPDATDEELTSPDLRQRLEARLPGLLAEFRAAVESLGFVW